MTLAILPSDPEVVLISALGEDTPMKVGKDSVSVAAMPAPEGGAQRLPALKLRRDWTRKARRKHRRRVLRGQLD
jgi:hypothetical protein